jgi:hypothetical protein
MNTNKKQRVYPQHALEFADEREAEEMSPTWNTF